MLSDGRTIASALSRLSCLTCGTGFHADAITSEETRAIYSEDYTLAAAAPKSDAARAQAYADWIQSVAATPRTILEIGCGSGALLHRLRDLWPDASCIGIDPALPDTARSDGHVRLVRGFVENIPAGAGLFDLIVTVNVIEHTADPRAFLAALRPHLAPNGQIIVVCPAAEPPNVELLFFDHLYSLTPDAVRIAGQAASLAVQTQGTAPRAIGDFQMTVFGPANDKVLDQSIAPQATLAAERTAYLDGWRTLDQSLLDRAKSCSRLLAFGAGQAAALLRAYAPRTWTRIDAIVLDDVSEAWRLGPPIASYDKAVQAPDCAVLVATSPHVQTVIAERLARDGFRSITWNDLIPR